jgi:cytochrome P450
MLINGSATRDERAFPDPDRFDVERTPSGHNLNFGYGVHSCLGAALARMEGRIALDVMLDLMPTYRVESSGLRRVAMANVAGWSNVPIRIEEPHAPSVRQVVSSDRARSTARR